MPGLLDELALVVAAFLIGAVPWGYIAGKVTRGIDLRHVGSGGTGATNVLRALGKKASAVVLILDILKGLIPVLAAESLRFSPWWIAAAAVATVAGHCWSPFIGFKGGKGVATGAGAVIALLPQTLFLLPVMALVVWVTRYVSLGSLVSSLLAAVIALALAATSTIHWSTATAVVAICAIIVLRHRANIERLWHGNERRIGEPITV